MEQKKDVKQMSCRIPLDLLKEIREIAEKKDANFNTTAIQMIRLGMKVEQKMQQDLARYYREVAREEILKQPDTKKDAFAIEKIGEGMVKNGYMTIQQVNKVLQLQKEKYSFAKKFGEIAIDLEILDQNMLDDYLVELEKKSSG